MFTRFDFCSSWSDEWSSQLEICTGRKTPARPEPKHGWVRPGRATLSLVHNQPQSSPARPDSARGVKNDVTLLLCAVDLSISTASYVFDSCKAIKMQHSWLLHSCIDDRVNTGILSLFAAGRLSAAWPGRNRSTFRPGMILILPARCSSLMPTDARLRKWCSCRRDRSCRSITWSIAATVASCTHAVNVSHPLTTHWQLSWL